MVTFTKARTDAPVQGEATGVQAEGASVANPNANESLKDLASLAAATVDAAPDAQAGTLGGMVQATPEEQATAKDIADILKMARDLAAPMVEAMGYMRPGQTAQIWNDAALEKIAEPAFDLMQRWGIDLGTALGRMGPYVGLLIGLWAPSMATWAAIQENAAALAHDGQQQ